jgi:hypothetical protein
MKSSAEIGCLVRYPRPLCLRPEVPRSGQFKHALHLRRILRQGSLQPLRKLGWRLILVEIDAPDIRNFNAWQPRAEGGGLGLVGQVGPEYQCVEAPGYPLFPA